MDATIKRENGVFKITEEVDAINIDKDATRQTIEAELANDSAAINVKATASMQKAKITKADLETIKDVLGTYTTDFLEGNLDRIQNLMEQI